MIIPKPKTTKASKQYQAGLQRFMRESHLPKVAAIDIYDDLFRVECLLQATRDIARDQGLSLSDQKIVGETLVEVGALAHRLGLECYFDFESQSIIYLNQQPIDWRKYESESNS
jgi:hypothetical protein